MATQQATTKQSKTSTLQLKELHLRNFKGIRAELALRLDGNVNIYGDNATGKTTLFDAFTWLLFDKDSMNRKDFEIKTLDENGQAITGLDHEVAASLDLDGKQSTLRKVYTEKYVKKRGQAEREFTGHETQHFIDSVPIAKKEYESRITSMVPEDTFKLLTNPRHFNENLHWQDRRQILLEVCGDVADADVVASGDKLAELPGILGGHALEDYRKIITARHRDINQELDKIPVRIDEVQRGLPEAAEDVNVDALVDLEKRLSEIDDELAQLEQTEDVSAKVKELDELGTLLTRRRGDWEKVNTESFSAKDTCPTCGQKLPAQAREKAQAEFDRNKKQRLDMICELGQQHKQKIQELKSYIEKHSQAEDHSERVAQLDAETKEIASQINNSRTQAESNQRREQGLRRIDELKAEEKALAKEYERLEKELYLTEEFIRTKVKLLEEKINSRFKLARFKLFDVQVNGGVSECCETTCNGVPYGSMNNGARLNIGLDIINTLSEYHQFSAPIWLDNAEAVTQLLDTKGQQIKLYVSEGDQELRIERGIE